MKTYLEIKANLQKELDKIMEKNGVFFAFSNEQFEKGKGKLKNSELVRIEAGGFMPKKNFDRFLKELEKAEQKKLEEIKKVNQEEVILYELRNFEAFYSGDITDAFNVLRDYGFTYKQVEDIYNKYNKQRIQNE